MMRSSYTTKEGQANQKQIQQNNKKKKEKTNHKEMQ